MKDRGAMLDPFDLIQDARLQALRDTDNLIVGALAWKILLNAELYLRTGLRSATPVPEVIYWGDEA